MFRVKSHQPLITIAVPSLNQGKFLDDALASIFNQFLCVEVFVLDGGSTDNSLDVIKKWERWLSGWRSHPDDGQSAAINEGIALGNAPFVCWLNSDDWFLPGGLSKLLEGIKNKPEAPMIYGRSWNVFQNDGRRTPVWVENFNVRRLALRCIVSQPATLIRRSSWESVGGLNRDLHLAMDYDLWWRLYKRFGSLHFLDDFIAVNREHKFTKTNTLRWRHYQEAMDVVRLHHGIVPLKWWLAQPYAVWYKSFFSL